MSPSGNSSAVILHLVEKSPATAPAAAPPARLRRNINQYLHWYAVSDAFSLLVGFICAWVIANAATALWGYPYISFVSDYVSMRLVEFLPMGASIILWFQHTDHYRVRMPFWLESRSIVTTLTIAMLADGFMQFAVRQDFSRLWLASSWCIAGLMMIGLRHVLRAELRRQGGFDVPTLLVGHGETAQQTRAALASQPNLGYDIVVQIADLPKAFLEAGRSWETLCSRHGVDYVMIALDGPDMAASKQAMAQLVREAIPFSISPPLAHLPVMGMVPQYFFNHDVMLLSRSSGLEQPLPRFLKRSIDILVSGAALLVLSPVMLAIAIQVRRDGGPAFFGHARLGQGGKTFRCLKFRSMVNNGDEVLKRHFAEHPETYAEWLATQKLRQDPRVTPVGNFLRQSSLDELPQLINVLKGDMSLVGPRPIVTSEIDKYEGDIAHYYRVRPGVTGLWQVSGRSDVSYSQRVHMDSWYVRNWSLWHDIAIICKTFPTVLKRSGAY